MLNHASLNSAAQAAWSAACLSVHFSSCCLPQQEELNSLCLGIQSRMVAKACSSQDVYDYLVCTKTAMKPIEPGAGSTCMQSSSSMSGSVCTMTFV